MRQPFAIGTFLLFLIPVVSSADEPKKSGDAPIRKPKLGVVLVFDQMRGDYLIRWKNLFVEGGFKRLQTEGAWFTNCHYPYSDTVTAAGHASLLTGCTPHEHGIIGNSWYERESGRRVLAVTGAIGPDPLRRRCPTLGDALLEATKGKGRVASISSKDRSAVLMGAAHARMVYWLSTDDQFETSAHYRGGVHPWVRDYNNSGKAKSFVGKAWKRLRSDLDYDKWAGPDNFLSEGTGYNQGRTFPHLTPDAWAVDCSPFGNELLLDFAKAAIDKEKLGQTDALDLLCVSFSANDLIGHSFGPDSQEVLDVTLRSDLIVKEFLEYLDVKVGKGNYFVVLSADHGVCPLPEATKLLHKREAGRVPDTLLSTQAEQFLQSTYAPREKKIDWIEATSAPWTYLNYKAIEERGLKRVDVESALARWLESQPGVAKAFTRTQLLGKEPLADQMAEHVRQSFYADRSGDVVVILKPYYLMWRTLSPKGGSSTTSHGSPHPYDTHVPLLVFGPGINPGIIAKRVAPQTLATIMAQGLGISPPRTAQYPVPAGLFREEKSLGLSIQTTPMK